MNSGFSSKGQYLSVEQMVLFSLGIVITISIYFSFSAIVDNVRKTTRMDNLRKAGNSITSGISEVYTIVGSSGENADVVNLTLDIPKKISGETYQIKTKNNKLLVVQDEDNATIDINMGDIPVEGELYPGTGKMKIFYDSSNKIIKMERTHA
jgi:hypothetical protein